MNKSLATVGYVTQIVLFLALAFAAFAAFVVEIDNPVNYPERYQIGFVGFTVGAMFWLFINLIFNDLKSLFALHLEKPLTGLVSNILEKIKTPVGKKIVIGLFILVYTPILFAIITNWNVAAPFVVALAVLLLISFLFSTVVAVVAMIYLKLWEKYNVVFDESIPDDLRKDYSFEARAYSKMIRRSLQKAMLPMKVHIKPEHIDYFYPGKANYFGDDPEVETNLALALQREVTIYRHEDSDILIVNRVT